MKICCHYFQEHGLVLVGGEVNGDLKDNEKVPKAALVTPESAQLLEKAGEGTLGTCPSSFSGTALILFNLL